MSVRIANEYKKGKVIKQENNDSDFALFALRCVCNICVPERGRT